MGKTAGQKYQNITLEASSFLLQRENNPNVQSFLQRCCAITFLLTCALHVNWGTAISCIVSTNWSTFLREHKILLTTGADLANIYRIQPILKLRIDYYTQLALKREDTKKFSLEAERFDFVMKVNTDFKAYITLAALVVGLTFTVLALSTNHWYDNKISSDGLARLGVKTGM